MIRPPRILGLPRLSSTVREQKTRRLLVFALLVSVMSRGIHPLLSSALSLISSNAQVGFGYFGSLLSP